MPPSIPAWPHGDPRDVARAILADRHYGKPTTAKAPEPSWLDMVWAWLRHLFAPLFRSLGHALGSSNPANAVIGFIIIGAALALLAYLTMLLVRSLARAHASRTASAVQDALRGNDRSAADLRTAALAAARAGRYRDAAALLFLSAGRALDERGRLPYDPARTPGEYRRVVRDPAFDALANDAVVALFDVAEPRSDLFERMSGAYDRFFATATP